NRSTIPGTVTVQIIPVANPDGLKLVADAIARFDKAPATLITAEGRFNQRRVDLNRNWDCNWQRDAWWGVREVSGGSRPFSESETRLLRSFLDAEENVEAVVFWHSAGDGVFPGHCGERLPGADALARLYANAAEYPLHASFETYQVTGDATDWLAAQGIPALVVELTSHNQLEWRQNLRAMFAVLEGVGSHN
ncbi:MAG: M14 family metallopeptidase, partial [Caldilineaceae bacterium]